MTKCTILLHAGLLLILFSLFGLTAVGQEQAPVRINPVSGEVNFDGMPNESVWEALVPFPMIMYQPVHGGELTEKTDVRIGFNNTYLYVGAHLYYQDVSLLQAVGKKRDYDQMTCDNFGLHLDTYHDRQNAMVFYTNPNGIRFDASVKRDMKSFDSDANISWNTYWEVKTQIDEKGWHCEMRIPLSSLRFQSTNGQVHMGLTIARFIPAKNEMQTWPVIPLDYNFGTWKPSLAQEVVLEGLESRKPFYVSPYLLCGYGYSHELNAAKTGYVKDDQLILEPGLDLKVGLTSNLTMDVTVNTDFAQVESDDQQINLTRFSLFFQEKRVFFQEKSDAFDFNMGGSSNLFYSRRIGLSDGQPVRILGGVRLTGRVGGWDVGALNMQTARMDEMPTENFGVVRIRKTVFNPHSYLGGMVTSRIAPDGSYNFATGLDGSFRVVGDEYLYFHLARTMDHEIKNSAKFLDPVRFQIVWDRRSNNRLGYDFTFTWSGSDFSPDMGFLRKSGYIGGYVMGQYGWMPGSSSPLLRHKVKSEFMNYHHPETLDLETINLKTAWSFEGRNGMRGETGHHYALEVLTDTLEFNSNTRILPGRYPFHYLSGELMLPPTSPVMGMFSTEIGQFYDGFKFSATLMPTWSISAGFDLSVTYRFDRVRIPDRGIAFLNHIIGIKTLFTFSTKTSLAAFVQYNTDIDAVIANVRFRYNPREGVDFHLVFNEGRNTNPFSRYPALPISDNRTVLAKMVYTWGR